MKLHLLFIAGILSACSGQKSETAEKGSQIENADASVDQSDASIKVDFDRQIYITAPDQYLFESCAIREDDDAFEVKDAQTGKWTKIWDANGQALTSKVKVFEGRARAYNQGVCAKSRLKPLNALRLYKPKQKYIYDGEVKLSGIEAMEDLMTALNVNQIGVEALEIPYPKFKSANFTAIRVVLKIFDKSSNKWSDLVREVQFLQADNGLIEAKLVGDEIVITAPPGYRYTGCGVQAEQVLRLKESEASPYVTPFDPESDPVHYLDSAFVAYPHVMCDIVEDYDLNGIKIPFLKTMIVKSGTKAIGAANLRIAKDQQRASSLVERSVISDYKTVPAFATKIVLPYSVKGAVEEQTFELEIKN